MASLIPDHASEKWSSAADDRRQNRRYVGDGIELSIAGLKAALLDISEGGLRAAMHGLEVDRVVDVVLAVASGETINASAQVRSVGGNGASLAFVNPTYPLMRFVIRHLADHHGVEPHVVR